MFLEIEDVLTAAEVAQLRSLAAGARFVDGRITSPHSTVKDNLQLDHGDAAYQASSQPTKRAKTSAAGHSSAASA